MSELQYMPLFNSEYFKKINTSSVVEMENTIQIALMMVSGFRDILDNLNFDEEKLRTLQFNLDDDYEVIEEILEHSQDKKIKEILDALLIQIAKLEMEIGDLILEHTHVS